VETDGWMKHHGDAKQIKSRKSSVYTLFWFYEWGRRWCRWEGDDKSNDEEEKYGEK
jgi:agmatine/peptidylarginine deiminase